jgi:hypothetical protein
LALSEFARDILPKGDPFQPPTRKPKMIPTATASKMMGSSFHGSSVSIRSTGYAMQRSDAERTDFLPLWRSAEASIESRIAR